ncbi:MAG: phosphoglycolate phosphatase [Betaproteobacteria bacterium]
MRIVTTQWLLKCVQHWRLFRSFVFLVKVQQKFKVKAVLIDLDGTLMHTAPEIARAINRMLASLERPMIDEKQIAAYIGEGAQVLIKRCLTGQFNVEPDAAEFAKAQKLFFEYYAQNVAESKPYPQVLESLLALKSAGFRLACVTNKPEKFTLPLLEASDLLQHFECVVSGDTLAKKKPEPDQIFYICEKFGLTVNEVVLIGDSETDITAARNAGCYIFTVPYGYNQGCEIALSDVDAKISHISEAIDLLQ